MLLDNQLLIKEKDSQRSRMCSNAMEVCQFIYELKKYQLSALEYKALNQFLSSILPLRDFKEYEKRRTLIVASPEGEISEIAYKEVEGLSKFDAIPEGYRWLGQIFAGAYTTHALSVARFEFGTSDNKIVINISRKSSADSLSWVVARELWQQQIEHFKSPMVPEVKADLVPFDPSLCKVQDEPQGSFLLKVNEEEFPIRHKSDFLCCLSALLGHAPSDALNLFVDTAFDHLDHFPKETVSSPALCFYVNENKNVFVGGNGLSANRKLYYAGKFFPAFFTGLSGNLISLRLGAFEPEMINVLLVRM